MIIFAILAAFLKNIATTIWICISLKLRAIYSRDSSVKVLVFVGSKIEQKSFQIRRTITSTLFVGPSWKTWLPHYWYISLHSITAYLLHWTVNFDNLLPGISGWMGAEFSRAQSKCGFLFEQAPCWGGWIPDKNGRYLSGVQRIYIMT